MSQSRVFQFTGKLIIPDNKFEYGISDYTIPSYESLTDVLMNIYRNSPSSLVKVTIEVMHTEGKIYDIIFTEEGVLSFDKSQGVWDWFIGEVDLGIVLFENVGSNVFVEIEDIDFSVYTDGNVTSDIEAG